MQALRSLAVSSAVRATFVTAAKRTAPFPARSSLRFVPASIRTYSSAHDEETFEEFTTRYVSFFENCDEISELQRGLNNCFSYDLVPAATVIESAIKCARRLDHFPTACRTLEALFEKTENMKQYNQYVEALRPLLDEYGVVSRVELGYPYVC